MTRDPPSSAAPAAKTVSVLTWRERARGGHELSCHVGGLAGRDAGSWADNLHAPAAAGTEIEAAVAGLLTLVAGVWRRSRRCREQLPAKGEFLGTMTIGEKAVMADAMKAVRQGGTPRCPFFSLNRHTPDSGADDGHRLACGCQRDKRRP